MADATGSSQPTAPAPQPSSDVESGKVLAMLCYIPFFFLIGLIVSVVCLAQKNNAFSLFHAKQALTLMIAAVILSAFVRIQILGWIVCVVGGLVVLILFILGIVNAAQGKYTPLPLIGPYAEKIFGSIQAEKK